MTEQEKILHELDDLYAELKQSYRIGDVNPESNAAALLELMRLFGRYIVATGHHPMTFFAATMPIPPVACG